MPSVGRPNNKWKSSKIWIPQPLLKEINEMVAKFKKSQKENAK